jgi:hypothetical protein
MKRLTSRQDLSGAVIAAAVAASVMSGCASTGVPQSIDPTADIYRGASLQPDLGSALLRVADSAQADKSGN